MVENPSPDGTVSFEPQIKPLFREKDRQSMLSRFDLWSYDSVSAHADAIAAAASLRHDALRRGVARTSGRTLPALGRHRQAPLTGAAIGPSR